MQEKGGASVRIRARLCLAGLCLAIWAGPASAQDEDQLTAKARLLPSIGPGLRAVRVGADGNLYVLTAPSSYVSVFGKDGKSVRNIPDYAETAGPASAELRAIRYGEDMDVDAAGTRTWAALTRRYRSRRCRTAKRRWPRCGSRTW